MARKTVTVKYGVQIDEPRRTPPWLKLLVAIAVIVGGIYGLAHFVVWVLSPTEEDVELSNSTPITVTATPSPTVEITPTPTVRPTPTINPGKSSYLSEAQQAGDHVKAWVYIPGVGLDTAVAQWKDNEYFKDYSITLSNYGGYGCPYLDYRSNYSFIREAGNIVIYGYNNLGGQQLESLTKYVSEDYFNNCPLIVFETDYGEYNFNVFSVHIEQDDEEYVEPVADEDKADFIKLVTEKSMFVSKNVPESDSVILTFSIDVESSKGERMLIHAYLDNY